MKMNYISTFRKYGNNIQIVGNQERAHNVTEKIETLSTKGGNAYFSIYLLNRTVFNVSDCVYGLVRKRRVLACTQLACLYILFVWCKPTSIQCIVGTGHIHLQICSIRASQVKRIVYDRLSYPISFILAIKPQPFYGLLCLA